MELSTESGIIVGNKEFEEAWNNVDNQKVMKKVCSRFTDILDYDERKSCQMHALWKCLKKFPELKDIKFTSSLQYRITWECLNSIKQKKRRRQIHTNFRFKTSAIDKQLDKVEHDIDIDIALSSLKPDVRNVVKLYYIGGYTMAEIANQLGCSKQKIFKIIKSGIKQAQAGV